MTVSLDQRCSSRIAEVTIRGILLTALAMAGSCTMGPDYERPTTMADHRLSYGAATAVTTSVLSDPNAAATDPNDQLNREGLGDTDPWWRSFQDPVTNQLVSLALANNPSMATAAARVLEAEALLEEQQGRQSPSLSYQLSVDRSKVNTGYGSTVSTNWSHGLYAAYTLDLFGKLRRSREQSWRNLLAEQANRQAVAHSLIASVVKARASLAVLQQQQALNQANTQSWQDTLTWLERRYRLGLAESFQLHSARENIAAAKAAEAALTEQLRLAEHRLDILIGRYPGSSGALPETLPPLPTPRPIPPGLPAQLLDRRPDLCETEMRLAQATAAVGVSIAALYPDLTLSGNYGFRAERFADIIDPYAEVYALAMRLAQPIFEGGQRQARVDAARARVQQASAGYASAILTALKEVEDALYREQSLRTRYQLLQQRLTQAQTAESLARKEYQQGTDTNASAGSTAGWLTVLESERRRRIAETELIRLRGELWNNRVDLLLALGGDWTTLPPAEQMARWESVPPTDARPTNTTSK